MRKSEWERDRVRLKEEVNIVVERYKMLVKCLSERMNKWQQVSERKFVRNNLARMSEWELLSERVKSRKIWQREMNGSHVKLGGVAWYSKKE